MGRCINQAVLLGHLGQDPEKRYTQAGEVLATFSLATSERYKDRAGEWMEQTEWHSLVLYGRLADLAAEYLRKGSRVHVTGKLRTRSWEKDGEKRWKTEIVVRELIMLDVSREGTAEKPPANHDTKRSGTTVPKRNDGGDDDLPF